MRVPAKRRREQIMGAAAELFSRRGFDGTTTREIARSAGVNEAIIFRHFTSKDELYWAVVSEQVVGRSHIDGLRDRLRSSRSPKQALADWAETLLQRHQDTAVTRLLLFSALRDPEVSEKFIRSYMKESFGLLADCIRAGVEQGRLREIDPAAGARAFLAMVAGHGLIQELFPGPGHQKYDPRKVGQE